MKSKCNNINVLKSDNRTEFINNHFKDCCKKNGIIHETTSPCARTMLINSNLSQELLAEAVNCATYSLNRRPCKANESKIPYEKWFG